MGEIEAMAVKRSGSGIVQDRLVGERDAEDGSQHKGGLPCTQGKRDIEGEDEAEDIGSIMDFRQIETLWLWPDRRKLVGLVMILPVLVAELELGTPCLHQFPFPLIELTCLSYPVLAVVVAAFVNGDLFFLLPGKQRMKAIGAVVFGFLLESHRSLKECAADLAQELSALLPIVVVEIVMRSITVGAHHKVRHTGRADVIPYGG
jgi:hypothetical protein